MSLLLFFSGLEITEGRFVSINGLGEQSYSGSLSSMGEQFRNLTPVGLGLDRQQLVRLDLSRSVLALQKIVNTLLVGDPFVNRQVVYNSLLNDINRLQAVLNVLSTSVREVHKLSNILSVGDPFVNRQVVHNSLLNDINGLQTVLNVLSTSVQEVHKLSNILSDGDVVSVQKLLLTIKDVDAVLEQQRVLLSVGDLDALYPSTTDFDLLIDGISAKGSVLDIAVLYEEDSVHNSISFSSSCRNLFWKCDPDILSGSSRVEVSIDGRNIYFLIEKRDGNEQSFSVWGRSLSAREETPYSNEVNYLLEEPKLASVIAEEILSVCSLDWQCEDWLIPEDFEFKGSSVEGILVLAGYIGAVVRCKDDGSILVRQKYPVRPVDMASAPCTVSYDRANLIRLNYRTRRGDGHNAVEVSGRSDDVVLPEITVEESSPQMGEDVHIRVYWAGNDPVDVDTYITNGIITLLGERTSVRTFETIVFKNGVASVSKSAFEILSVCWIGDSGGAVTHKEHSKDLSIENSAFRIATVSYVSKYVRYRLSNHYVSMLLALLSFGGDFGVAVNVKFGDGDNPAPTINSKFITNQSIAVIAGTAWLDANSYDTKLVSIEAPYENVVDGDLVYINDAEIDCVGSFHVSACEIKITPGKIVNRIGVVQCQV